MVEGKVRWFDEKKGFGFIGRENEPDVFVHYKAIKGEGFRTLIEGEPVTFEIDEDHRGVHATNVIRLDVVNPPKY